MMKSAALICAAAMLLAGPAFAQNTTAATGAKAPAMAPKAAKTTTTATAKVHGPAKTEAKTPEGKACSAQADAQNLHGKARKAFRSKCKDEAKAPAEAGVKAAVKADAPKT